MSQKTRSRSALSTDGGLTFHVIANISKASLPGKKAGGDNRGLFRFVDQPTITAAHGEVWVVFNAGGPMAPPAPGARARPGRRLQSRSRWCRDQQLHLRRRRHGPSGQVMDACTLTESGQGGGKIS
jgi:hypothetical protein